MAQFEEKKLRTFLVGNPKPVRIVAHTETGGPQEVTVGSGITWASIAHTICAMNASLVEVFDAKGALSRATRADEEEEKVKQTNVALGLPVTTDPETMRLTHFANLLTQAWQFSTQLAFDKMVMLFELQTNRSIAIEQRLERTESQYRRTLEEQVRDAFDEARELAAQNAQPSANPLVEMAQHFLGGMQAGAAVPPSPPPAPDPQKPNGVKHGAHK